MHSHSRIWVTAARRRPEIWVEIWVDVFALSPFAFAWVSVFACALWLLSLFVVCTTLLNRSTSRSSSFYFTSSSFPFVTSDGHFYTLCLSFPLSPLPHPRQKHPASLLRVGPQQQTVLLLALGQAVRTIQLSRHAETGC